MHQFIQKRISNPEVEIRPRALAIAAFAIGGAVQGGIVGSVFTQEPWYHGLWKGALAGSAIGAATAGLALLFDPAAKFLYGEPDRCDLSWGDIGRNALSVLFPAAIVGAAAGAVVAAPDDRARTAGNAALWGAIIWGLSTAALDYTRKIAPPAECR